MNLGTEACAIIMDVMCGYARKMRELSYQRDEKLEWKSNVQVFMIVRRMYRKCADRRAKSWQCMEFTNNPLRREMSLCDNQIVSVFFSLRGPKKLFVNWSFFLFFFLDFRGYVFLGNLDQQNELK